MSDRQDAYADRMRRDGEDARKDKIIEALRAEIARLEAELLDLRTRAAQPPR